MIFNSLNKKLSKGLLLILRLTNMKNPVLFVNIQKKYINKKVKTSPSMVSFLKK